MTSIRLKPPVRRETPAFRVSECIEAALEIAAEVGAQGLIRDRIAEKIGISGTLLHRYFGSMDHMREIVIKTAFLRGNTDVLYKSLSIEDFKKLNTNPALTRQLCEFLMS